MLNLSSSTAQGAASFDRSSTGTRLKRDENTIRWVDLLDKFKHVQERTRRTQAAQRLSLGPSESLQTPLAAALSAAATGTRERGFSEAPRGSGAATPGTGGIGLGMSGAGGLGGNVKGMLDQSSKSSTSFLGGSSKHKSGLSNLGRLGIGGRKSKK